MYIIYGTDNCRYCKDAKDFLTARGEPFEYRRVEDDVEHFKNKFPGRTTVPQIIYILPDIEWYVGGYDDLRQF